MPEVGPWRERVGLKERRHKTMDQTQTQDAKELASEVLEQNQDILENLAQIKMRQTLGIDHSKGN